MGRGLGYLLLLVFAIGLLALAIHTDLTFFERTNTYGNFDTPSEYSFPHRLLPGTADHALDKTYSFSTGIHVGPLVALGVIFIVFFLLQRLGSIDVQLGISRWLTAWCAFVVSRFGLMRVSGVAPVRRCTYGAFPFLNCQACEMASGGCPIGMFQMSLLHHRFPVLPLVVLLITGLALGRWICGWLCPFGMLSDIFDRASRRSWRPRKAWSSLKFGILGLIVVIPIAMGAAGTTWLPFCATLCPSGSVFGLLPYYATTGAKGFVGAFADGGLGLLIVLFHTAVLVGFIYLAIRICGRVFCKYLCPLGAFLGIFCRVSMVRVVHEAEPCNDCGKCSRKCPMGINLAEPDFLTQSNCVLCGRCVKMCPSTARRWRLGWGKVSGAGKEPARVSADA